MKSVANPKRPRRAAWRAPSASALARAAQLRRLADLIDRMPGRLTESLAAFEELARGAVRH